MRFEWSTIGSGRTRPAGWSCLRAPELEKAGISHGFMTRPSDSILRDAGRRAAFIAALSAKDMVVLDQVHGDLVQVIASNERPRTGDGLVLLEPGVIGAVKTADCVPVILYSLKYPAAAVVHAGWRGTARQIGRKAVAAIVRMGVEADSIGALIGPCIGPCCYSVGEDVAASFRDSGIGDEVFARREGVLFLDLKKANRLILMAEGVRKIDDSDLCTSCRNDLFFSARREGSSGRQLTFALIKA